MVLSDLLGPLPATARGNAFVFKVVDLLVAMLSCTPLRQGQNEHGRLRCDVGQRLYSEMGMRPHLVLLTEELNSYRRFAEVF